jgi:hypothetical protein
MLGDFAKAAALDVDPQGCRQTIQIMQGNGDGDAVGRRGDAHLVVGSSHPYRQTNDLPWRRQPLHH